MGEAASFCGRVGIGSCAAAAVVMLGALTGLLPQSAAIAAAALSVVCAVAFTVGIIGNV